ncbi:MAG TPA: RluA family pseudouridine synthase [Rubrivivax sp.]|nr:RluA family pseudouridine synthase [Rubrivivax sp.]
MNLQRHNGLAVIHADEALVAVDKPPGLLSVPGRGEAGKDNLTAQVQAAFDDALVVHRLDMGTSGLMLFARGAQMQRALSIAFAARRIRKTYVALVEGRVAADSGQIDAALRLDWPNRPRQIVDNQHGKPSSTRWHVLQRLPHASRLELHPLTGRSHQLRVHLQSIGHPICGDELYGPLPLSAPRLMLHATHLEFQHPATGQTLALRSEPSF